MYNDFSLYIKHRYEKGLVLYDTVLKNSICFELEVAGGPGWPEKKKNQKGEGFVRA